MKTEKQIVNAGRHHKYRLEDDHMIEVFGAANKPFFTSRWVPKGECRRVLMQVYVNAQAEVLLRTYRRDFCDDFYVKRSNGQLEVGCQAFTASNVRKLARWVGTGLYARISSAIV